MNQFQVQFKCPDCFCHRIVKVMEVENCCGISHILHHDPDELYKGHPGGMTFMTFSDWTQGRKLVGYFCYRCGAEIASNEEELWKYLNDHNMVSKEWIKDWDRLVEKH